MTLKLDDLPPDADRYLLSLVRADLKKMERSHPKLAAKFPDAMVRAGERRAYVEQVYAALMAARSPRRRRSQQLCDEGANQHA